VGTNNTTKQVRSPPTPRTLCRPIVSFANSVFEFCQSTIIWNHIDILCFGLEGCALLLFCWVCWFVNRGCLARRSPEFWTARWSARSTRSSAWRHLHTCSLPSFSSTRFALLLFFFLVLLIRFILSVSQRTS
jgi:hypothetical protein